MKYHRLLQRQLKKVWADNPPSSGEMELFLDAIHMAYLESDSDRKMLERSLELSSEELLEANADLRALFQAFPDVLFRLDRSGLILDVKSGHTQDLLKETAQLVGRQFQGVPDTTVQPVLADALAQVRESNDIVSVEYGLPLFGELNYFEARLVPTARDQVIAIVRNITRQRLAQDALAEERKNLERTVDTRTRELRSSLGKLEDANRQLAEANQNRSRLLSRVSHELRTPLNGILGYCDLLLRVPLENDPDKARRFVSKVEDCGQHLLALINDLLDLAKIDAGAMELELDTVSLQTCLQAVLDMIGGQEAARELKITSEVDQSLPLIQADQRKLRQIALNLMSNAVKFTPAGGTIVLRAFAQGSDMVRVEVADTGAGIAPEDCEYIFSEFGQARNAMTSDAVGTGIGLALTRRLVELHGGKIGVESDLGVGSTFWFMLPTRVSGPVNEAGRSSGRTGDPVMIIERDAVTAELVKGALSMHPVAVKTTVEQALTSMAESRPKLVLVDAVLLGHAEDLRKQAVIKLQGGGDIPVIGMMQDGRKNVDALLDAGCVDVIQKPFDTETLVARVSRHVPTAVS